jgi:hypothetical protein
VATRCGERAAVGCGGSGRAWWICPRLNRRGCRPTRRGSIRLRSRVPSGCRWLREQVLTLHRLARDWDALRERVNAFLSQFAAESHAVLQYVGLTGQSILAQALNEPWLPGLIVKFHEAPTASPGEPKWLVWVEAYVFRVRAGILLLGRQGRWIYSQLIFEPAVQLVQGDVGQDRAGNPTLRGAGVGRCVGPASITPAWRSLRIRSIKRSSRIRLRRQVRMTPCGRLPKQSVMSPSMIHVAPAR